MGIYGNHILPRIINCAMGMSFIGDERQKCLTDVSGRVLEIGFGSGHNLPYYSNRVEKLVAIDPSAVSAKLARKRILMAPFPVDYIPLEGEKISAPDASFDSVVSTFTLCTIPDVAAALRQLRRVLKPTGHFFFLEHGRSPDPSVQRKQTVLNGVQRRLFGGCHLNRDIERLIRDAGFEITSIEKYYSKGPKFSSYLYRGIARPGEARELR
jgi:ubiquinone/menaquinone biosynthesis C-methylase UbiE